MDTHGWYRRLAGARAVLALACLGAQLLQKSTSDWAITAVVSVFVLFSLGILAKPAEKAGGALLCLIADTIFFLIFASFGADWSFWLSSTLYFYLLASAVMLHRWWDVCIVVATCVGLFGVTGLGHTEILWRPVFWAGLLACMVAFEKSRIEQRLAKSAHEAEDLRAKAETIRQEERQRIAGDFHDGPMQSFISFQIRLEFLRKVLARDLEAGLEEVRQMQELAKSQVSEMRALLRGTRPLVIPGDSLAASLRQVVSDFQKDSRITATFQSSDSLHLEGEFASLEVLQILREALNNVQKHAGATRVAVTANESGRFLEIAVEDNGVGFGFSGSYSLEELDLLRMGPASIKTRVRNLGGRLTAESRPGRGAALRIRIPT